MRRPLVVVAGSLVVLLAVATAAIAVVEDRERDGGFGYGMHQVIVDQADRGRPLVLSGAGGWMPGAAVTSEFTYLTEMVAHHEEAVEAARQLERCERPQLRAFGQWIVASQTAQIDQIKRWLSEWYPRLSTDVDYLPMMRDLSALSGDRLDRAFLQEMIPHHMAAVMMSQHLLVRGLADHDEVKALAVSVRDEQHTEIVWMQRALATWFNVGWPHGPRSHMRRGSGAGAEMRW